MNAVRSNAFFIPLFLGCILGCDSGNSSSSSNASGGKTIKLLNVSYDPTRELYLDFNESFAKHWKEKTGDTVEIDQSHGDDDDGE